MRKPMRVLVACEYSGRVRAALARAPLPALTDDEVYTLRCAAENMRSADAENSATIVDARFRLASKLEKIANRLSAAPAQADEAQDAARLDWIDQQIADKGSVWILPSGESHQFVQLRHAGHTMNYPTVPGKVREAIDASIAASLAGKVEQQ